MPNSYILTCRCNLLDEPWHVRPETSGQNARKPDRRPSKERRVLPGRRNVLSDGDRGQSAYGTDFRQAVPRRKRLANVRKLSVHRIGQGMYSGIILNIVIYSVSRQRIPHTHCSYISYNIYIYFFFFYPYRRIAWTNKWPIRLVRRLPT